MNLATQLRTRNAEDFWSNVSGRNKINYQPSTYRSRQLKSQLKNDSGSDRDLTLQSKQYLLSSTPKPICLSQIYPPSVSSHNLHLPSSSSALKLGNQQQTCIFTEDASRSGKSNSHVIDIDEEACDKELGSNPRKASMYSKNKPHPSLEVPPFYFFLKKFPYLLENIKSLYRFRWAVSYPLQKRVCFANCLRQLGIHMTWGELLILLPFLGFIIVGTIFTFAFPSVGRTGYFSRLPLLFAIGSAVRNSIVTLLLGMPFERALWYHKLAGRIAFINGILHTYVAYAKQDTYRYSNNDQGSTVYTNLVHFSFGNTVNVAGTFLLTLMTCVVLSSLPYVRRKFFELFYYIHIVFVAIMAICAFYHSGIVVPVVAGVFWGLDLVIRKLVMALTRYPRKANLRIISDTVVEISFPKLKGFDYNPGQFIYIAVPELSIFEWHPFSISSCPMQGDVTLHIRKVGTWTSSLHLLAEKRGEISILLEGPYGSPSVDITGNRYKTILLFSGGIGITPTQSISNQLVYEYSQEKRDLRRLALVWIERDPVLIEDVDVVQRSTRELSPTVYDIQSDDGSIGIASTLLSMFPMNQTNDDQLAFDYPIQDDDDTPISSADPFLIRNEYKKGKNNGEEENSIATASTVGKAYERSSLHDVLDLQVYLTSNDKNGEFSNLPFVRMGRPNVKEIFKQMKTEALDNGEKRIAVFVCAPPRLAQICRNACVKFSDDKIRFDLHVESLE